jgi:hypothetical protein
MTERMDLNAAKEEVEENVKNAKKKEIREHEKII